MPPNNMAARTRPQLNVRPRSMVLGRPLVLSSSRRFHTPSMARSSSSASSPASAAAAYERVDDYRLGVGVGLSFEQEAAATSASATSAVLRDSRGRADAALGKDRPWRRHHASQSICRSPIAYLRGVMASSARTGDHDGVYVKQERTEHSPRQVQGYGRRDHDFDPRFVQKEEHVDHQQAERYGEYSYPYPPQQEQQQQQQEQQDDEAYSHTEVQHVLQPPMASSYHHRPHPVVPRLRHQLLVDDRVQPLPLRPNTSARLRVPANPHVLQHKPTAYLRFDDQDNEYLAPPLVLRKATTTNPTVSCIPMVHHPTAKAAMHPAPEVAKKSKKKRKRRICTREGCDKYVVDHGLCIGHGGGKRCYIEGCGCRAQNHGLCWKHGGYTICLAAGCKKRAKSRGVCWNHGGGTKCKEDGCITAAVSHGLCWAHGGGRRCVVAGCQKLGYKKNGDLCIRHFAQHTKGSGHANDIVDSSSSTATSITTGE